jgi:hypothetical protein
LGNHTTFGKILHGLKRLLDRCQFSIYNNSSCGVREYVIVTISGAVQKYDFRQGKITIMPQKLLRLTLVYLLWLASDALFLWLILEMRVLLLIDLPGDILHVNPWLLPAIDKFGLLILSAVWLSFMVISESRFRKLSGGPRFYSYVLRVFVVEALLLSIAYGLHLLV